MPCTHTYHSDCVASLAQTIEETDLTEYIIEQEALHLLEEDEDWDEANENEGEAQQQHESNESEEDDQHQQQQEDEGSMIFHPTNDEDQEDGNEEDNWGEGEWTDEEEAVMVEVERAVRFMVRDNNLMVDIRSQKRIVCPDCRREYIVVVDDLPVNIWVNRLLDMKQQRSQEGKFVLLLNK